MFIQIASHVRVYLTRTQIDFVKKYKNYPSFRSTDLLPEEIEVAKILGDKSIFVRKKLDNGVQYALNRSIRFVKNARKK
jgi:hypothetical protein|tara:strand:- start:1104 stop:1340 length:237 start_codon:yes stop_codon:yes gene_type:complete